MDAKQRVQPTTPGATGAACGQRVATVAFLRIAAARGALMTTPAS